MSDCEEKDPAQAWEERVLHVRHHFERKGYRVHSGLQFGCELVLYADDPGRVHSDFCVHVVPEDGSIDWRAMQTLVRSMPDLHKTLILANLRREENGWTVDELAMATEHAPFRHKNKIMAEVGTQRKKQKSQPVAEEELTTTRSNDVKAAETNGDK